MTSITPPRPVAVARTEISCGGCTRYIEQASYAECCRQAFSLSQRLVPSNVKAHDQFGSSLRLSNRTLIVGAIQVIGEEGEYAGFVIRIFSKAAGSGCKYTKGDP
jgi:hypothetical protein